MKVAHFTLWAPHRSGLFEFVKEQVKYEKRAGIDSLCIHCDIENPDPNRFREGDLVASPWSAAYDADIWVMHRSIPAKMIKLLAKKKSVAILHGTSEIMIQHEVESQGKNDKFNMHIDFINTFTKTVAITKYDYDIMKQYDNGRGRVVYINDAIDTEYYTIEGRDWDYRYHPAIISCTNVRVNKHPAPIIWAMPEIIKQIPTARLNIFGLPLSNTSKTWENLILKSSVIGISVENVHHQMYDFRPWMRGADISFNGNYNGIFSRADMEAMACGCSIVAFTPEHTPYATYRHTESVTKAVVRAWEDLQNDPEGQILKNRAYAEENFSMEKATKEYIKLYESL